MKVFKLIISLLLVAAFVLSLGGCFKFNIDEPTTVFTSVDGSTAAPIQQDTTLPADAVTGATDTSTQAGENPTTAAIDSTASASDTTAAGENPETQAPATQAPATQAPATQAPATQAPATQAPTEAPVAANDPSGWTKEQIVEALGAAVNKSKAYKGELDVDHSESFVAEVTSITGGQVFAGIASRLIGLVTKPTNETLHYVNGSATNSEGEVVPILLPKRNEFCLSPAGVASASAVKNDQGILITIKLIQEVANILDIPLYHSQCMGYLDVASLDVLKNFDTYDVTFTYAGSTITAQLNSDGYVSSATYFIPVHFEGSGSKGILSGEGVFDGSQTEVWTLHW